MVRELAAVNAVASGWQHGTIRQPPDRPFGVRADQLRDVTNRRGFSLGLWPLAAAPASAAREGRQSNCLRFSLVHDVASEPHNGYRVGDAPAWPCHLSDAAIALDHRARGCDTGHLPAYSANHWPALLTFPVRRVHREQLDLLPSAERKIMRN